MESLKYDLAKSICPKLEEYKAQYKKHVKKIPAWMAGSRSGGLGDQKELRLKWNMELDKMTRAMKMIIAYHEESPDSEGYDIELVKEGLESFGKYFFYLGH